MTAPAREEMNAKHNDADDQAVFDRINALVAEEGRLYALPTLSEENRERLEIIKVQLDQCWDLLRQRQALREFGRDPNQAQVRPPEVVENYEG